MSGDGIVYFDVCKVVTGADNITTYPAFGSVELKPIKITMHNTLNKEVNAIAPDESDEDPAPSIIPLGIKSKSITFNAYVNDCAYVMGSQPPFELLPQNAVLQLTDDPDCIVPEFSDGSCLWKIKAVSWSVDSKKMLWEADITTSYVWDGVGKTESMFFE